MTVVFFRDNHAPFRMFFHDFDRRSFRCRIVVVRLLFVDQLQRRAVLRPHSSLMEVVDDTQFVDAFLT